MKWEWGPVEAGRAARALKVNVISLDLKNSDPSAEFVGSKGDHYTCTLDDCTCPDFSIQQKKGNRQPCKHIIRLAMERGILNRDGRTDSQQLDYEIDVLEWELALYAWHYYVLDDPDIPDSEYDDLKERYLRLRKGR